MRGNDLAPQDRRIIRRSAWINRAGILLGIGLLLLGALTWSTDTTGGVIGFVGGAAFVLVGLDVRRRLRTNPQEILSNHAALKERDRKLPLWRHALDWVVVFLVGTGLAAWMLATILAAGYGPALTAAWFTVAVSFFATSTAMVTWGVYRYRRSRRIPV